jgi:hypothetical protein
MSIKYHSSDLEVFIITYNRWDLLKISLNSLLNQDINGFNITVLDNGSDFDNNSENNFFINKGVKYVRFEKNDQFGIWITISEMIKKSWVMIFHDDDIMHKTYISSCINTINNFPNINFIGCFNSVFKNEIKHFNINTTLKPVFLKDKREFTFFLLDGNPVPFCSMVYKSSVFKNTRFNHYHNLFGKVWDRPMMIESSKNGGGIILKNKFIKTRIHESQDSYSIVSTNQSLFLLNLIKYYYEILEDNALSKFGRKFLKINYLLFLDFYNWGAKNDYSFRKFIEKGIANGSTTRFNFNLSFAYNLIFNFKIKLRIFKKYIK